MITKTAEAFCFDRTDVIMGAISALCIAASAAIIGYALHHFSVFTAHNVSGIPSVNYPSFYSTATVVTPLPSTIGLLIAGGILGGIGIGGGIKILKHSRQPEGIKKDESDEKTPPEKVVSITLALIAFLILFGLSFYFAHIAAQQGTAYLSGIKIGTIVHSATGIKCALGSLAIGFGFYASGSLLFCPPLKPIRPKSIENVKNNPAEPFSVNEHQKDRA